MSVKSASIKFLLWLTGITIIMILVYASINPYLIKAPETAQSAITFASLYIVTFIAFVIQILAFRKFPDYTIHVILLTLVVRMVLFLAVNFGLIYFFKDTAVAGVILFFSVYLIYTIFELIALLKHINWLRSLDSRHS